MSKISLRARHQLVTYVVTSSFENKITRLCLQYNGKQNRHALDVVHSFTSLDVVEHVGLFSVSYDVYIQIVLGR